MAEQVVGAKVRIDVNEEGSYEGYVHHIDPNTKKLTLVKVVSCTTGTRLHGLHYFFPKEITGLTVLEQKKVNADKKKPVNKVQKDVDKSESGENLVTSKVTNERPAGSCKDEPKSGDLPPKYQPNYSKKYLQKDKSRRDPSDDGLRLLQKRPGTQNCTSENFVETSQDRENFTINPPDVVMIDSLGEAFEQAMAYISRQRVVGVAWEGLNVGRFGQLCLIQIGCNKCIYIFDIVTLGPGAFDCGLADIMDSADILKVIHNSRHFSDALFHQYAVSLVNVFDTQVADAIIYRNEVPDRKFPRQTSSLISCLYEYLDLSPDEYHFHKVRLKHMKNDEMVWKNRPLHNDLINAVAKTVMYLRELRLAQMERMMEEFIHGVDIYLSCVRDASDEVVRKRFSSTALPEMFHEFRNRRERSRYRQLDAEMDNNECNEQRQVWEEGHYFMEKYEQSGLRVREHKYPPFATKSERSSAGLTSNDLGTDSDFSSTLSTGVAKQSVFDESPNVQLEARNPIVTESTSRLSSGRGTFRPSNTAMFSQGDFPQLSSDSDSGSPSGVQHMRLARDQHGKSSRDPRFGRGRAASLIRNAQLPGVRQPNERQYGAPLNSMDHRDRLQFPSDEELLTSSEVVSAAGYSLPSGPRVRISHQ